jgi:hypothetical protein
MSAEIIELNVVTKIDLPAERVLRKAIDAGVQSCIVVGYDANGEEYFCSSIADGGTAVWLMERCKLKLLRMADGGEQ